MVPSKRKKQVFIKKLACEAGISEQDAEKVLYAFARIIRESIDLKRGILFIESDLSTTEFKRGTPEYRKLRELCLLFV